MGNNNNQSAKPKVDLNDVLIRHRAVLRSALPSQIIEALDQQVEKMRTEQIRKRKEWQIKYQQHLKQQRAVYNLDDDDDEENTEEIVDDHNGHDDVNESPLSSQGKLSEISSKSSSLKSLGRSKSESNGNDNSSHKIKERSPNKMLSSPPLKSSHSAQSFNKYKEAKTRKIKKRNRNIFGHSTPIICGGLGGGLALNYNHNVHKYHKHHRFNKSEDNSKQSKVKKAGGSQSFDEAAKAKTKPIKIMDRSIGGMSVLQLDNGFGHSYGRQRALSSESISVPSMTPSSASKPITFSKDDDHRLNRKYYAGRSRGNNSPKMTRHLFDLKNMNEYIATKDATSVVTNSFTATHDDDFKFIENHF